MSSSINTDDLDFMYTALLNCNLFRLTKHLCDTTIMSDFRGFAGHSAILSAGSEYLKSLIQTTVPSQPCVLDLRHFSSDLVQCLVEYIYTGEVVVPDCRGDTHGYVTFLDICGTDVTKKTKYKIESRESFEKYWNLIYENNNKRNFNEYANNINLGNNILHNINLNNTWDALSKHISSNHHVETSDVEKLHHARNIFTKLKEYRNSNTLTETTLICGDWRYNCHGVVICAVSRYVNKAVLMRGGLFNMDISHFPSFSVESILTYFYTGQFDCSGKSLEDYGGVFMALVDLETGIENRSRLDVKMYEGLDGHEDTEGGGKGFMNISMAGLKESMENASMGGEGNASQTNGWNEDEFDLKEGDKKLCKICGFCFLNDESLKSHQREHLDEDIRNKDQGKKQIQGLEQRLSDAEKEIEREQVKHTEAQKVIRKQERRVQELHFQLDEGTKEHDKLNGLVDKLQQKMQGYKKQAMEAEEIAAMNVGKYRKLQQELEESEARADLAESLGGQYRSSIGRAESLQPLGGIGNYSSLSGYSGLSGLNLPSYLSHTDHTSHQLPPSGLNVKTRVHHESKMESQ